MKNMQKYIAEPENMQFSVSPDFFGGGGQNASIPGFYEGESSCPII